MAAIRDGRLCDIDRRGSNRVAGHPSVSYPHGARVRRSLYDGLPNAVGPAFSQVPCQFG
jgi:hypothetical protein